MKCSYINVSSGSSGRGNWQKYFQRQIKYYMFLINSANHHKFSQINSVNMFILIMAD